jgi:plastocyanin
MRNKNSTRLPHGILVLIAIALVSLTACGEAKVEKVQVSPETKTVRVGETVDFDAVALSDEGKEMKAPSGAIQWSVEGDIGTVDEAGVFTAQKVGKGTVLARSAGLFDEAVVTVEPQPVARIEAHPQAPGALPGDTLTVTLKGFTRDSAPAAHSTLSISSPTQGVSVSRESVTLDESGAAELKVTLGPEPGENTIVIQSGDVTERVSLQGTKVSRIEIRPGDDQFEAGQTIKFEAIVHGKYASRPESEVSWSVTGIHAEAKEGGEVRMKSPGKGIIVAEYDGIIQGHPFTIVPGKLASISVKPESANLNAGENMNFMAEGFNAHGYPIRASVEWKVEGDVGAVAGDGMFLAARTGSGSVKAISGDIAGEAKVTVEHGPLASIQIGIKDRELTAGDTVELTAYGLDAFGNRFSISPEWHFTSPLGRIDEKEGSFTALYAGKGEIRAQVGKVMDSAGIEVSPAQLAQIRLLPESSELIAGETVRFDVRGFDRFGNRVEVEPTFSIRESLGEMNESGLLEARKAGSTIVEARAGDFTDQSTVAVRPAQMEELVVKPETSVEAKAGAMQDFDVYGVDRFGNVVVSSIQWSMSPELGSLDDQGRFLPKKAGKAEIVASVTQTGTEKNLRARIPVTVMPGETVRIDIEPSSVTATAGEEVKFSAASYDRFGNETETPLSWSLKDPTAGFVSANGLFFPVKAESIEVYARHANVIGTAQIEVKPARVAFLKIVPDEFSLKGGERVEFKAIAEDRFGNLVDQEVAWSLSNASLGEIMPWDKLMARKAGSGLLVAAAGNIVDTAPLTVTPGPPVAMKLEPKDRVVKAGTNVAIEAKAFDAGGNPVEIDPQWSVAGELGAIGLNGILLTKRTGAVEVVATKDNLRESVMIEVIPAQAASAQLEPESITASAGDVIPLSYEIYDVFRNEIPRPNLTWQVEHELGYVTSEGDFHAKKAGEGFLRLQAGEAVAQIPVKVAPGSIHAISIEPAGIKLKAGEKIDFTATGYDAEGNRVEFDPVWSVAGGLGTLDDNGSFLAKKSGNGYVSAKGSGVTGVASIGVLPGPVARIDVSPDRTTIEAGNKMDFKAVAYDAYGNVTTAELTWQIDSQKEIAEISDEGTIVAQRAGEGSLIASAGGVSGQARITVEPAELAGIVILPRNIELSAGDKVDIRAVGHDAYGNAIPIEPELSVEPAALGYFTQGLFVAGMAGRGELHASDRGIRGSIPVKVEEGGLSYLQIELPKTLMAGKAYDLNAVGYDAGCNVVSAEPRWAVTEDIGKIDPSTGELYVGKTGRGVVVAYADGVISERVIDVSPGKLDGLFLSPNPVTIKAGETHDFEVYGFDGEGNKVSVSKSAVEWSIAGRVGEIEDRGQFIGKVMGHGKVVARLDGKTAESYVTVTPGVPDPENSRIRISYPMLPADGSAHSDVIIEVRDAYNNPVPGAQVTVVSSRSGDVLIQPPETNDRGLARGRISSEEPGDSTLHAIVGERTIVDTEQVNFG